MAKFFSNKKAMAILSVAASVVMLAAALTAAWWYIKSDDFPASITGDGELLMGRIEIEAGMDGGTDWMVGKYQPGDTAYGSMTVENTSDYIDAFVKFEFSADTVLGSDSDGVPLVVVPAPIVDDPNVTFGEIEEGIFGSGFSVLDGWAWYTDASDNYYLHLPAGKTVTLVDTMEVLLDGPGMGNEYMDAEITVKLTWEATQFKPDAILDSFGVAFGSLTKVNFDVDAAIAALPTAAPAPSATPLV